MDYREWGSPVASPRVKALRDLAVNRGRAATRERPHQPNWGAPEVSVPSVQDVIPNTVALIHGARHPENARKLIEFLLSKETELALSRSASRQIPLGPVDEWELPEQVRRLKRVAERSYPIGDLDDAARVCLAWLKGTYLQ